MWLKHPDFYFPASPTAVLSAIPFDTQRVKRFVFLYISHTYKKLPIHYNIATRQGQLTILTDLHTFILLGLWRCYIAVSNVTYIHTYIHIHSKRKKMSWNIMSRFHITYQQYKHPLRTTISGNFRKRYLYTTRLLGIIQIYTYSKIRTRMK